MLRKILCTIGLHKWTIDRSNMDLFIIKYICECGKVKREDKPIYE